MKLCAWQCLYWTLAIGITLSSGTIATSNDISDPDQAPQDPFDGVEPLSKSEPATTQSAWEQFFSENFGFRKELMSQFGLTHNGSAASRQSVGLEILKKFSSETKTFAAIDLQGRLVRRDGFVGSLNDMEGMHRPGWAFEYHNVYFDFYNFLDPVLTDDATSANVGRFNARLGRFYVPVGLNLQTDTHGSILQLSNERNFGFERDWYVGLWGNLNPHLRYDVSYLTGTGYALKFSGQSGLIAARVGLSSRFEAEYGIEAGVSFIGGQRLSPDAVSRSPAVAAKAAGIDRVDTLRAGVDFRYRKPIPGGVLTWTTEITGGRDTPDAILTQLYQLDYLHFSRRFALASQVRWFWQDMSATRNISPANAPESTDSSVLMEATWYFANDVSGSNLHWIKLNCETQLSHQQGAKNVIWTLQYYWYW